MTTFEALFGIRLEQVKKNCILLPLLPKGILREFGIRGLSRGKLYASANSADLTLINTGLGAALTGDAVLYLKDSACKNVILFGSCGLVKEKDDLSFASLVCPHKCYSSESFSEMLSGGISKARSFEPDQRLLDEFLKFAQGSNIHKVVLATVSSLKLEEDLRLSFKEKGIEAVDMECSAFFCACAHAGLKALALFYASDIIKLRPFYRGVGLGDKLRLYASIKHSVDILCEFIKKNLSG